MQRRMKLHRRQSIRPLFITAALYLVSLSSAQGQRSLLLGDTTVQRSDKSGTSICEETAASSPLRDTFRQACLRKRPALPDSAIPKTIIIGFVGGFVKRDNAKHPEVQFAAYLRDRYPSAIHAEVFSNHDGQEAFRQVLRPSPAIITALLRPPKKTKRELSFTATVGAPRRQSHSPRNWEKTIFRYCLPSKSILLLSLDGVDPRFLRTWPARSIFISPEDCFMGAQKFMRLIQHERRSSETSA